MNAQFTKGESSTSQFSYSPQHWNYDVFLSFRGEDTRKTFTGHLYSRLRQVGVNTFIDDEELRKGDAISRELEKAIEDSRISIVVFSKNYASSSWCLDELVKIIECKEKFKLIVLPIFYDVDPSEVRKQTGCFGEALTMHKERFGAQRIEKWKCALNEAANLSGWDLQNAANGHESKFIESIIQQVLQEVNQTPLDVACHPVGLDTRIEDIESLFNECQNEVRMVGIYGVGGIGKTTLAKAIYNRIFRNFDGSCFLSNVRSEALASGGLVKLQQKLLRQILMKNDLEVDSVDEGINLIKDRLGSKKVIIVLDDLDHVRQLQSLARDRSWFGWGSLIIITTRDEHLLCGFEENERYKAKLLNADEAMQLFSCHAFNHLFPPQEYVELVQDITSYSCGLALALATLGSHLQGRSVEQWRYEVKKLRAIPHSDILEILKISYDGLDGDTQSVFLDIACAFHGFFMHEVTEILNASGFHSESAIATLIQRQLLNKDVSRLVMHDLVRDMGKEIVRMESPRYPGRRSRLFIPEEVFDVLQGNKGSEMVEVLVVDPVALEGMNLRTETFKNMKNLRVLIIDEIHIIGDFELLSKELRWLSWQKCPLKCVPSNFPAVQLVVLKMKRSNIQEFGLNLQCCKSLKELDLSKCMHLRRIANINGSSSLKTLLLDGCISLTEIHPSIGKLDRLTWLNLIGCEKLKGLPSSICHLKSLKTLDICGCSSIQTLPNDLGDMQSLKNLIAGDTGIRQVPGSVEMLRNLQYLRVGGQNLEDRRSISSGRVLHGIQSLSTSLLSLELTYCGLSGADIPKAIGCLSSLEVLDLSGNSFHYLPFEFSKLRLLRYLRLKDCENLRTLPSLSNLENLVDCELTHCKKLVKIPGLDNLPSISNINMIGCTSLQHTFNEGFFSALAPTFSSRTFPYDDLEIALESNEIPEWCSNQVTASSICFTMPTHIEYHFLGIIVWYVRKFVKPFCHHQLGLSFSIAEDMCPFLPRSQCGEIRHRHAEISYVHYRTYFNMPCCGPIKGGEKVVIQEYCLPSATELDKQNRIKKIGIHLFYLDQYDNVISLPAVVDDTETSPDINENSPQMISVEVNHEMSTERNPERASTTGTISRIWSKISSLAIFCCFNP